MTEIIKKNKIGWFKYSTGFIICLFIRLLPLRPPNIEPILAMQMPFSKAYGKLAGFSFAFFSILVYDILTREVGIWTLITATTYGLLGFWATAYLKNKKSSPWTYAKFAVMGTITFDIITGLSIGPIFFHQQFLVALVGQIPFTVMHLIGNTSFAIILSPAIEKIIIENKKFEMKSIINIFNPKPI